jgi:hypothetical protein
VIELLIKRVWYRTLAIIWRIWSGSSPLEASTARPSPVARLPLEAVEIIIAHLIYDTRSLLACSLTCYSWYIAAVPHLHHTLIVIAPTYSSWPNQKFIWPRPLRNMHKFGLLPLVKKFHIQRRPLFPTLGFSQKLLNCFIIHHFFALINVRELGIDYLDIPSFMPRIRRYFHHFLPTVHSLALREPKGSRRQILCFIGMFEHLEDLKLLYNGVDSQPEPADDHTLIPPFVPPLRGRLTMMYFTRVGLLEDMIDLFRGIRFRYMDLFEVDGMRLLLDTCAETLETLRLYPGDPRGKDLPPCSAQVLADTFAARSSLRDFDLSRAKSLRTLEIRAQYLAGTRLLTYALSTITSSAFSEVTVFYRDLDFYGIGIPWPDSSIFYRLSPAERAKETLWHEGQFRIFRTMQKIRDFQLVLCADVWDGVREYAVRRLRQAVAAGKTKRGIDNRLLPSISPEPLVVYSPRGSRQELIECRPGLQPWVSL